MADTPAAPRPARRALLAHVETVERLTPSMIRVVVGGDALAGFGAGEFTDHYVKLQLPPAGAPYALPFDAEAVKAELPRAQWPRLRSYTVRAWDEAARRLTLDFVCHGDEGIAGPWALGLRPGDPVQLLGPGGGYAPDATADWHLLVGDMSVLPAIAASLERIPAGVPVHVLVQVDGPKEEQPLSTPGDLRLTWLHDPTHDDRVLVDAVRALDFPAGRLHAFVHGEASAVRNVRRHLVVERGVPVEQMSVSGYWKLTRTDEEWREDKAAWKAQVEQDAAAAAR
ncbi:siderophore-interacting protein [Conexibacter arvalis]|uniref:NADPH-dependent ferric siderophore reductase n=1 Tax=Conexibacter arvalis TaxID=912552 RepID=A0A840ICB4_9ACTN|nr:siderophore-interacting protein [Conexibacter arvalis]MBB4661853.1 NADPH-dependent ferric siderophore reductase [Conexibacter arvalis]